MTMLILTNGNANVVTLVPDEDGLTIGLSGEASTDPDGRTVLTSTLSAKEESRLRRYLVNRFLQGLSL